jgi:UDP-hydrolysing UDP-N-acetyl-D-glucosamine 2-epimerase
MSGKRKKICIVVNSRANYGRIKTLMEAIQAHRDLELQLIVGASALLFRFGKVIDVIEQDGFCPDAKLYSIVEGENPVTMAKSTGLAITELATLFENLAPDIVVTVADRFETLATAVAASYMNIRLAHTQGGEVTGSIDESVRHAITKLAHIHFPATELAAENVQRMGERSDSVFCVGCPSIDLVAEIDFGQTEDIFAKYGNRGVGADLDSEKPYLVVLQHPVTTEYGSGFSQITETLKAVERLNIQTAWLWPNVDAGSDEISKGLRMYRESHPNAPIHFYHNFEVADYARLIWGSACLIGNSSSAIREGAFLGVPAVNIGTRQSGREHASNVCFVGYDETQIVDAVYKRINHGRYPRSSLFGDGQAGPKIAEILAEKEIPLQKKLSY